MRSWVTWGLVGAGVLSACGPKLPPVPASTPESLEQACAGKVLDLAWWEEHVQECRGDRYERPRGRPRVHARLAPAVVRVPSGEPFRVDYVVANAAKETQEIWIHQCDVWAQELEILDARGRPVSQCPRGGGGCGGSHAPLTLEADGRAHVVLEGRTDPEVSCLEQPLPAGEYQLVVRRSGALPEAVGVLLLE